MSERKVLNKYYPPDFDPSKIPRVKRDHNKTFTVRLMAPFNMRCTTCGEYIYKGRKFNARKEDVENEDFLGLRIYRFYIKCTRCLSEISFKTDPQSTDYIIETGATRNFMALKLAEEQAAKEEQARKEEEASNPMKMLENRTKQSREEIEAIEALEELREMNKRQQTLDYEDMLDSYETTRQKEREMALLKAEQDDEELIKKYFGANHDGAKVKRIIEDDEPKMKMQKLEPKVVAKSSSIKPTLGVVKKPTLQGIVMKREIKQSLAASEKIIVESPGTTVVTSVTEGAVSKDSPAPSVSVSTSLPDTNASSSSAEQKCDIVTSDNFVTLSSSFEYSQKGNQRSESSKVKATGLSLLGAYSDSGTDSD